MEAGARKHGTVSAAHVTEQDTMEPRVTRVSTGLCARQCASCPSASLISL